MSATKLSRYLVTPSRVASLMDWKTTMDATAGAVMALDITRDRIGVAVASHPSTGAPARTFDPISLPSRRRDDSSNGNSDIASELEEIVASERVCAFVVRWPLQDGGRMGGKCGKVLHALDSLVAPSPGSSNTKSNNNNKRASSTAVIGKNRPFALYDDRLLTGVSRGNVVGTDIPDDFGRLSSFGRVPPLPEMFYSSRQPHAVQASHDGDGTATITTTQEEGEDDLSSEMAAKVLQDFLDGHFSTDTEEEDFLGLNNRSARKSSNTRASAMPKSSTNYKRRNLLVSNKRQETVVAQAARDSIDEEGKQAYISQSLL
mmetsp:Transcript_37794/g.82818  ORF Transcript_37794/g.82818 Transcript_37794/m.82818 type:complete len:317 (-) Transcript_37794:187-1137(-)